MSKDIDGIQHSVCDCTEIIGDSHQRINGNLVPSVRCYQKYRENAGRHEIVEGSNALLLTMIRQNTIQMSIFRHGKISNGFDNASDSSSSPCGIMASTET